MNNETEEKLLSIPEREEKVLQFWRSEKIFEKTVEEHKDHEPYVFYDGPPFATGLPHYGHLLQGTIKDIVPRYQTMRGRYVRREWGWDCHGLPMENIIEKQLGLKHKRDIEEYGIENFNQKAREGVLAYDGEWKSIVPRMGRFVDMEKSYKTMDATYTESIWWAFHKLYSNKLIYEGYKSMHICPRCETTLAISEVGMNYQDTKDISVYVMFELVDEPKTYMLAWTTTPWTLPGNVAVAVHPEVVYAVVEHDGKRFVVAKERVEKVFKEKIYTIVEEHKGKDFVGKSYHPLFDYYVNDESLVNRENGWKVYPADFVTTEDGTGVVHEAPAFGEQDMELAKRLKLPMIQHVAMDGSIKPEVKAFAGMQAKPKEDPTATDVEVIKVLAAKGVLFAKEKIEHSYPFCWRCETPLLNYAASSWFVDVETLKPRLIEENKEIAWVPENIRDGRFGNWVAGARDWAISRSRYWGAPLPVWKCNTCSNIDVFGSIEQLKEKTRSRNSYFLLRHGEAENNVKNIVSYSLSDTFHLTPKGEKQAKDAAATLKDEKITRIIASPVLRTKETAEILRNELGLPKEALIFDERIAEVNTGDMNGCSISTYRSYFSDTLEKFTKATPNGENLLAMKDRLGEFIYEVDRTYKGEHILIVTHEYAVWLLQALRDGMDNLQSTALRETRGEDYVRNGEVEKYDFAPIPHDRHYVLDFHRPYVDELTYHCSCELGEMQRIPDVFDCWFESGSMPFASVHYMGRDDTPEGKLFQRNFPADFIAEAVDQTRGWFYTMLVLSVALFDRAAFRSVVTTGLVLAEDGRKMSKKLKNYPDPMLLADKYGADTLRLYMINSPVVRGEDLRFSEKGVEELYKKVVLRLDNVRAFYDLYRDDMVVARSVPESKHVLDQWIITRLSRVTEEMTRAFDAHELDRAVRPIPQFIDDLSTWYVRRSRDRFKEEGGDRAAAIRTLGYVLFKTATCIAPVMPFYAEDLYLRLPIEAKKESVHLEAWGMETVVHDDVMDMMHSVRTLVTQGLELRAKAGIKVRQPLSMMTIPGSVETLPKDYLAILLDELNVKGVAYDAAISAPIIDTVITTELRKEGQIRDLLRGIQEMRKKAGLRADDAIVLTLSADQEGQKLIESAKKEIATQVRAEDIVFGPIDGGVEISLEGITVSAMLEKA